MHGVIPPLITRIFVAVLNEVQGRKPHVYVHGVCLRARMVCAGGRGEVLWGGGDIVRLFAVAYGIVWLSV
jgi:hypothetical protein